MYNHRSNAGNTADILKHNILMQLVSLLKPQTYFESHCGYPYYTIGKEEKWISSWMKIWLNNKCHCTICDTNPDIFNSIPVEDIAFIQGNGWEEVWNNRNYDLYFVDPPYDNRTDFMYLNNLFISFKYPLVAWYPIFRNTARLVLHGDQMETFFEPEGRLIGCGMAFKNIDTKIIKEKLKWSLKKHQKHQKLLKQYKS